MNREMTAQCDFDFPLDVFSVSVVTCWLGFDICVSNNATTVLRQSNRDWGGIFMSFGEPIESAAFFMN